MSILDNQLHSSSDHIFTEKMRQWLITAAKWARFVSIVGFVFIGLLILAIFSMGSILGFMANQPGLESFGALQGVMFVPFLIIIALFFFPNLYMYQFATHALNGAANFNTEKLEASLEKLKSLFKFAGIYIIVILSFYALAFLIAMIGLALT